MKSKSKVSRTILRRRIQASFSLGVLYLLIVILSLIFITRYENQGAYSTHRKFFVLNEKVWKDLSSPKNLSVEKPVPAQGKEPRINGMLGLESDIDSANYKIIVESGQKKLEITPAELKLLPKVGYSTDFRCIEGWSEETQFAGARFSEFMNHYQVGKKSDGSYYRYVGLETPDREYYVSIDMPSMLHDQTLLSYEMNLAPLSLKNGNPLRLVIPIKYGIKSLKRVGKIFFSDVRPPDYWAERGYDWYSGL